MADTFHDSHASLMRLPMGAVIEGCKGSHKNIISHGKAHQTNSLDVCHQVTFFV